MGTKALSVDSHAECIFLIEFSSMFILLNSYFKGKCTRYFSFFRHVYNKIFITYFVFERV
jgi:hypothetical protein